MPRHCCGRLGGDPPGLSRGTRLSLNLTGDGNGTDHDVEWLLSGHCALSSGSRRLESSLCRGCNSAALHAESSPGYRKLIGRTDGAFERNYRGSHGSCPENRRANGVTHPPPAGDAPGQGRIPGCLRHQKRRLRRYWLPRGGSIPRAMESRRWHDPPGHQGGRLCGGASQRRPNDHSRPAVLRHGGRGAHDRCRAGDGRPSHLPTGQRRQRAGAECEPGADTAAHSSRLNEAQSQRCHRSGRAGCDGGGVLPSARVDGRAVRAHNL